MATSDAIRGATTSTESKTRLDEDLETVLKHAEHGSVEDFAKAFYFARLDLQSAIQRRVAYDFESSKKYLRVLALHQRRDILAWLLETHEVVESMVNVLFLEACKHSSTDFLAWLKIEMSKYFYKSSHPAKMFRVALEHGSVEVASAVLRKCTPREVILETYTFSKLHPNVVDFWRKNCCPEVLSLCECKTARVIQPDICQCCLPRGIKLLIEANDVENLAYIFDHFLIQQGVATLEASKDAFTGAIIRCDDISMWLNACHNMVNMCLKLGHWKCAKVILGAIDLVFVDLRDVLVVTGNSWVKPIRYFRVDYPERMDEKEVADMVEWTMSKLKALLTVELQRLAPDAHTNRSTRDNSTGSNRDSSRDISRDNSRDSSSVSVSDSSSASVSDSSRDSKTSNDSGGRNPVDDDDLKRFFTSSRLAYEIASVFIDACDSGIETSVTCFTEDMELYQIVRIVFIMCNEVVRKNNDCPNCVRDKNQPLRRAATIQTLLEHGLSPRFVGYFTNIAHVWGKDREWKEWAISGSLHPLKVRTGHLDRDVLEAFSYLHYDILGKDREPFVSMPEEEQFKFLKWFSEAQTSFRPRKDVWMAFLRNRYVTADNVVALLPDSRERARAVKTIMRDPDLYEHVSIDVFNALAQSLSYFHISDGKVFVGDLHSHEYFDNELQITSHALAKYLQFYPKPSRFLVHGLKVLVLRLQTALNECLVLGAGEGLDPQLSCVCESKDSAISVPLDQRQQQELLHHDNWRVGGQSRSCSILHRNLQVYRGLGFQLANDHNVLEFGLSHWFLSGNGKDVSRALPTQSTSSSSTPRQLGDTAKYQIQVFSFPIFAAATQQALGNLTIFQYWREYLGLAHTPEMYIDVMRTQERNVPYMSNFRDTGLVLRNVCLGIKMMRRDLDGVDTAPSTVQYCITTTLHSVIDILHCVIFRYCGRRQDAYAFQQFVDISSVDCAFLLLLEEIAALLDSTDGVPVYHHPTHCPVANSFGETHQTVNPPVIQLPRLGWRTARRNNGSIFSLFTGQQRAV